MSSYYGFGTLNGSGIDTEFGTADKACEGEGEGDRADCTFDGDVEVSREGGIECWTCPECAAEHEDDVDED